MLHVNRSWSQSRTENRFRHNVRAVVTRVGDQGAETVKEPPVQNREAKTTSTAGVRIRGMLLATSHASLVTVLPIVIGTTAGHRRAGRVVLPAVNPPVVVSVVAHLVAHRRASNRRRRALLPVHNLNSCLTLSNLSSRC